MKTHLVWFRNDLRLHDNPALYAACDDKNAQVFSLFISTPEQWKEHGMSAIQASFIHNNLIELKTSLKELNIPLLYERCAKFSDSIEIILNICQKYQVDHLFFNKQYEVNEKKRDELLSQKLSLRSVKVNAFEGNVLLTPLSLLNGQNEMYKVFTSFKKIFKEHFFSSVPSIFPKPEKRKQSNFIESALNSKDFSQSNISFAIGEKNALKQFSEFCTTTIKNYHINRDFPALDKTSRLSPYFSIGVLSVKYCAHYLIKKYPHFWLNDASDVSCWFNELIWRDFYQHLMVAFPKLSKGRAFVEWTENITWNNNKDLFNRWKTGTTGFPIIDAAMQQLNQTGWMHNRLRMIVASFLVKDLLINWRWGEHYFMSKLIDGDLAANNGGWQWAASTGTDATPFFRIFNPQTQGEKFDPKGNFIRYWIPELKDVPTQFIHQPLLYKQKHDRLLNYPDPIVDHKQARGKVLQTFEKAKNRL